VQGEKKMTIVESFLNPLYYIVIQYAMKNKWTF